MKSDDIFQTISRHHREFSHLGVHRIGLFGSAVRGELTSDSDLDFLVEFRPGKKITTGFLNWRNCSKNFSAARLICLLSNPSTRPCGSAFSRRPGLKLSTSYLEHILAETEYLLKMARPLTLDEFLADETLKRAFVRSLEIIGEAVKNLPDDLKYRYPDIDWKRMAGTRDRLIHGYFSVDLELVWDIIRNKIPALDAGIRKILSSGA